MLASGSAAEACQYSWGQGSYEIDAESDDDVPPTPPSEVVASLDWHDDADLCEDYCFYGFAVLTVSFEVPSDDQTPSDDLGYQLSFVDDGPMGRVHLPSEPIGPLLWDPGEIYFHIDDADGDRGMNEPRDMELYGKRIEFAALIAAVDRAGNVSSTVEFSLTDAGSSYDQCELVTPSEESECGCQVVTGLYRRAMGVLLVIALVCRRRRPL